MPKGDNNKFYKGWHKIIVKNQDEYVRMRKYIHPNMLVLEKHVNYCPYCGKAVTQKGFVKKRRRPSLLGHLRSSCHKSPWYWDIQKYHFRKKQREYDKKRWNWVSPTTLTSIYRKHIGTCKNLKEFVQKLDRGEFKITP